MWFLKDKNYGTSGKELGALAFARQERYPCVVVSLSLRSGGRFYHVAAAF